MKKINFYNSGPAMARVLLLHADWLRDYGLKLQAASCRAQAASLTRKYYCRIGYYRKGKINYVNKRSKKNNYIIKQA